MDPDGAALNSPMRRRACGNDPACRRKRGTDHLFSNGACRCKGRLVLFSKQLTSGGASGGSALDAIARCVCFGPRRWWYRCRPEALQQRARCAVAASRRCVGRVGVGVAPAGVDVSGAARVSLSPSYQRCRGVSGPADTASRRVDSVGDDRQGRDVLGGARRSGARASLDAAAMRWRRRGSGSADAVARIKRRRIGRRSRRRFRWGRRRRHPHWCRRC